jgi:hypothetical protein
VTATQRGPPSVADERFSRAVHPLSPTADSLFITIDPGALHPGQTPQRSPDISSPIDTARCNDEGARTPSAIVSDPGKHESCPIRALFREYMRVACAFG